LFAWETRPRRGGWSLTRGGANRGAFGRLAGLESEIATGGHDVVVFTESIDLVELRPLFPALFEDYAGRIIAASRDAGATPILYATPYVEALDHTGFHEMADPQLALGGELGVGVAAGGLAWLREWAIRPDLDLYHTDRAHPGFVGSYLSALVIYAEILDASPVGLTEAPSTDCSFGVCTPISRELATELQGVAWEEHLATGRP